MSENISKFGMMTPSGVNVYSVKEFLDTLQPDEMTEHADLIALCFKREGVLFEVYKQAPELGKQYGEAFNNLFNSLQKNLSTSDEIIYQQAKTYEKAMQTFSGLNEMCSDLQEIVSSTMGVTQKTIESYNTQQLLIAPCEDHGNC